jgi:pyrroline-5-carboxylate reductase
MQFDSIGFIGGGRITRILLAALTKAGRLPAQVVVSDANAQVLDHLHRDFHTIQSAGADNAQPASCDLIFVSLHPPVLADALQKIKSALKPNTIVVSLAPKLTLSRLSAILDRHARIVRMIPNAPSMVNSGYNPVAFSRAISKDEKAALSRVFNAFGECPEVLEKDLEAYAVIAAMGPTYLWFQWQALCELGKAFGLEDKAAMDAVAKMVSGALHTMFSSDLSPEDVMDLVPVKPLAEDEDAIRDIYTNRLTSLFNKLKG